MFDNSKVSDASVIKPAPRVEGCELYLIKRDMDPASKSFRSVSFHFRQKATGAELVHREFAPSKVINGKTLSKEELEKNVSLIHSRIAHITRAFLDEATFLKIKVVGDVSNIDKLWDDYVVMTGQALGASPTGVTKAAGQECALKVIYKNVKGKFYASLPSVPPFISTANHPKEFTTNPQYDKYEMEKITPDQEQAKAGFEAAAAPTPTGDFGGGFGGGTNHPSGF